MIDTRKCETYEERYDAIASEHFKMEIRKNEKNLSSIKRKLEFLQACIDVLEKDNKRLSNYITAYETTYPNRPWEVVSIE